MYYSINLSVPDLIWLHNSVRQSSMAQQSVIQISAPVKQSTHKERVKETNVQGARTETNRLVA